jgi:very-short-patch-repair endonuclease
MPTKTNDKPGCTGIFLQLIGITPDTPKSEVYPYKVRDNFLSKAELSFYHVLSSVVGNKATICIKVRLRDIIYTTQPNENRAASNRIQQKHLDFLLCNPKTMQPILGIELDDSSHSRTDRIERDDFIDKAFEAAGLPVIHIKNQNSYNMQEIAEKVASHINLG